MKELTTHKKMNIPYENTVIIRNKSFNTNLTKNNKCVYKPVRYNVPELMYTV